MEQNEIEKNKKPMTRINLKYTLMNIRGLTEGSRLSHIYHLK
jgi:hypothetical protein